MLIRHVRYLVDPIRLLFGEDVFISYARADGLGYASGLAAGLAAKGLACRVDLWETSPGRRLPAAQRLAMLRCRMLVLLATPAAAASEHVLDEVKTFLATGGRVIPVDLGGIGPNARWSTEIIGLPISPESNRDALRSGLATEEVLARIANAGNFVRRNQRLRYGVGAATITLLGAAVLSTHFSMSAVQALGTAKDAEAKRTIAETQASRAEAARSLARAQASEAATRASEARSAAEAATLRATAANRTAMVAQRRARLAQLAALGAQQRAELARKETDRQTAISEARRMASLADATTDLNVAGFLAAQSLDRHWTLQGHRAGLRVLSQLARPAQRFKTTNNPQAIAISPDGLQMAVGDGLYKPLIRLWDVRTGAEIFNRPRSDRVMNIVFSANGRWLADADCGGTVTLSDVNTGTVTATVARPGRCAQAIAFNPDDSLIAVTGSETTDVYAVPTGSLVFSRKNEGAEIGWAVAFSPDGQKLAVGTAQYATLVNLADGVERRMSHPGVVHTLAFSPDGRYLATGLTFGSNNAFVWDVATRQKIHEFPNNSDVNALAFSPDGKSLATGADRVRVWDWPSGREILSLDAAAEELAYSSDGGRLFVSGGGGAYVWDAKTGTRLAFIPQRGFSGKAALSSNGQWLASVAGGAGEPAFPRNDAVYDDGQGKGDAQVRPVVATASTFVFPHQDMVGAISFDSTGGYLVSGSRDGTVQLWDLATGTNRVLTRRDSYVHGVAFSPDNKFVASAAGAQLDIIELKSGVARTIYRGDDLDDILDIQFIDDGHVGFITYEGKLVSADISSGMHRSMTDDIATASSPRAFMGRRAKWIGMAGGGYQGTMVLRDRAERRITFDTEGYVGAIAIDPAMTRAAIAEAESGLRILDLKTNKQLLALKVGSLIDAAAFDPSGRWLALGLSSAIVILDTQDYEVVAEIPQTGGVEAIAFNQQGDFLAVSMGSILHAPTSGVAVWKWRSGDLVAELCNRIDREPTEWQRRELNDAVSLQKSCALSGTMPDHMIPSR